jgi:hypothetical protein
MNKLDEVLALGFDNSDQENGRIIVSCPECEATCIQGVPCHERGCRNQMHECFECNNLVPKGCKLCDECHAELQAELDYVMEYA